MNWDEVCEHKSLQDLPFRIELNRWGQVVLSPITNRHSFLLAQLNSHLHELAGGHTLVICPIHTADNVKVADVAWFSAERYEKVSKENVCSIAPEICVEVMAPGNSLKEMTQRKDLFFDKGALEFWLCAENGGMSFYNQDGKISGSHLVPGFPAQINPTE